MFKEFSKDKDPNKRSPKTTAINSQVNFLRLFILFISINLNNLEIHKISTILRLLVTMLNL